MHQKTGFGKGWRRVWSGRHSSETKRGSSPKKRTTLLARNPHLAKVKKEIDSQLLSPVNLPSNLVDLPYKAGFDPQPTFVKSPPKSDQWPTEPLPDLCAWHNVGLWTTARGGDVWWKEINGVDTFSLKIRGFTTSSVKSKSILLWFVSLGQMFLCLSSKLFKTWWTYFILTVNTTNTPFLELFVTLGLTMEFVR